MSKTRISISHPDDHAKIRAIFFPAEEFMDETEEFEELLQQTPSTFSSDKWKGRLRYQRLRASKLARRMAKAVRNKYSDWTNKNSKASDAIDAYETYRAKQAKADA